MSGRDEWAGRAPGLRQQGERLLKRAAELPADRAADAVAARRAGEAKMATARALETGQAWDVRRAQALRSEAGVALAVASFRRPAIGGDAGPRGAGRGALEVGKVGVLTYDPKTDSQVPSETQVARRAVSRVMRELPADLRATAERFQALMEGIGAIRCVDMAVAGGSNRISDGGAAARWDADRLRARAARAIGRGIALRPRGAGAHADRRRMAISDRAVVEGIVLRGWELDAFLERYGWSRRPEHRQAVRSALCAALARIMEEIG